MSIFPPDIAMRFNAPSNSGISAGCRGVCASFACGSATTVGIEVGESGRIENARFSSNGCAYAVAAADVVCEALAGRETAEFGGDLKNVLNDAIESALGAFPAARAGCASIAVDAAAKALDERRDLAAASFNGESALVCACFGVGEDEVAAAIEAGGLSSVEEVGEACRAGLGCGACRMLIAEMLDARP